MGKKSVREPDNKIDITETTKNYIVVVLLARTSSE